MHNFDKNTIKKIYERRSFLTKLFKDIFLTPKQKKFYEIVELPNHWEYETIFQCIMESWLIDKNKKREYEGLLKNNIKNIKKEKNKNAKEDLSFELYKIKPLENLNILEIGGYFALNLEKLGCKAIKKDAAIDEKEFITLTNYKSQLKDDFFDIAFSKELIDIPEINNKELIKNAKKLLTVFSGVTKKNGMSIHEGSMPYIIEDKPFLSSIGFKLISVLEGKRFPNYDVYVLKKKTKSL